MGYPLQYSWAPLVSQTVKNPPAKWETWVQSLGWEDPLKEDMATYSSILTWEIPWTEEPGGSMGHSPWGHKESDMNEHTHTHKPLVAALSRTRLVPPWPGL